MSHAVKTETARSEFLRVTHVGDGTGPNIYMYTTWGTHMAVMYYACADCGNAIQEIKMSKLWDEMNRIGEYCDCCSNWNPEVVVRYR
jgi:hypothetical protein